MASTNKTSNLELSQFVGSDKPDWLTDYNGDMLKIDNNYGIVAANAEIAADNAQQAASNAAKAITRADEAVSNINELVETVNSAEETALHADEVANNALIVANNTAALGQQAVGTANEALAKAASAKTQAESALASAGVAEAKAANAESIATQAAEDVQAATDAAAVATGKADSVADDLDALKSDVIPTLASVESVKSVESALTGVSGRVSTIEGLVPDNASVSNKLATMADVDAGGGGSDVTVDTELNAASNNPVTNAAITAAINSVETATDTNAAAIATIDSKIPANASASNQLATMADIGNAIKLNSTGATLGERLTSIKNQLDQTLINRLINNGGALVVVSSSLGWIHVPFSRINSSQQELEFGLYPSYFGSVGWTGYLIATTTNTTSQWIYKINLWAGMPNNVFDISNWTECSNDNVADLFLTIN